MPGSKEYDDYDIVAIKDDVNKDKDRSRRHLSAKLRKAFHGPSERWEKQDKPEKQEKPFKASAEDQQLQSQVIEKLKTFGLGEDEISDHLNITKALENNYSNGNVTKAAELLLFFKDSFEGLLAPITHSVNGQPYYYPIIGSDNYHGVSCYIDSLLFAMFARIRNFEPILYKQYEGDENRDTLALFLRLYVSMLRAGKLVTTDIVGGLMDALIDAGWKPVGGKYYQQDAGELFAFITEKLNMPLLTLKVDIVHAGKEVQEDDHKLINESLLHVPIPGSKTDGPILLEECLELYFANSIQVSRQLERRRTLDSLDAPPYDLMRDDSQTSVFSSSSSVNVDSNKPVMGPRKFSLHIEPIGLPPSRRPTGDVSVTTPSATVPIPQHQSRERDGSEPPEAMSVVSSVLVDEEDDYDENLSDISENQPADQQQDENQDSSTTQAKFADPDFLKKLVSENNNNSDLPTYDSVYKPGDIRLKHILDAKDILRRDSNASTTSHDSQRQRFQNNLWTSNMEITLPAWMFLQLLPFYTDASDKIDTTTKHASSSPVTKHFANARPVLGICLKRYAMTKDGNPVRNDRVVVVPQKIRLPSFVADGQLESDPTSQSQRTNPFGKFELVLESAVFHRGESLNSGHFVAVTSEDAFIPYDDSTVAQNTRSKKRSKTDRLWTSLRSKESSKPGGEGLAVNPTTTTTSLNSSAEQISPPASALSSPALRPIDVEPPVERRWVLFDDMKPAGEKVTPVDYNKVFSTECPYMLFYRMVAMEDGSSPEMQNYEESRADHRGSGDSSMENMFKAVQYAKDHANGEPDSKESTGKPAESADAPIRSLIEKPAQSDVSTAPTKPKEHKVPRKPEPQLFVDTRIPEPAPTTGPPLVTISPVETLDLNLSETIVGTNSNSSLGTESVVSSNTMVNTNGNGSIATGDSGRSSIELTTRTFSQLNPFNSRSSRSRAASPDKPRRRHHRDKYREEKCSIM